MASWIIWLILTGFFLILEIFTISFLFFWFGVGAFLAFLASIIGLGIVYQIAVFAISTTLMVFLTKPLAKKLFNTKDVPMNNKTVLGKNGVVLKKIDNLNSQGQVKVQGEIWTAIGVDDEIIEKGSTVIIESIDGVKLIVKKV